MAFVLCSSAAPRAAGLRPLPGAAAKPGWRCALTTMPATRPTLGVSRWPDFDYDSTGATTLGHVGERTVDGGSTVELKFDVRSFEGPPVDGRSTKVFGVPLPPGRDGASCRVVESAQMQRLKPPVKTPVSKRWFQPGACLRPRPYTPASESKSFPSRSAACWTRAPGSAS